LFLLFFSFFLLSVAERCEYIEVNPGRDNTAS
jgi:hypothetical protein